MSTERQDTEPTKTRFCKENKCNLLDVGSDIQNTRDMGFSSGPNISALFAAGRNVAHNTFLLTFAVLGVGLVAVVIFALIDVALAGPGAA